MKPFHSKALAAASAEAKTENPRRHVVDEIWTMRDGTRIAVGDMDESHVRNALRMVIRTSRKKKERARRLLDDLFTVGDTQDMLSNDAYNQLSNLNAFFPLLEGGRHGSAELSARYDPRKR